MSDSMPYKTPAEAGPPAWFAKMRARAALADAARPANRAVLFDALARAGITVVTVEFDGAGDSGQIEAVTAHADDTAVDLPAKSIAFSEPCRDGSGLESRICPVAEAIETLAYDFLEETHDGWENNDGAFGTFSFDVTARTIRLEYNERVVETDYSEHEF